MHKQSMDVTALGELLIDFTSHGQSEQGNMLFEANPGGAVCNVLAMLSNLGHKTAYIGKVGADFLGDHLENVLESLNIHTEGLIKDPNVPTTLAFVHNTPDGDRDFSFYRNPGADMRLTVSELKKEWFLDTKAFHFGTLSMTHPDVAAATEQAIRWALNRGAVLSFDPNLRIPLWDNMDTARSKIIYGLSVCRLVKISKEELFFVSGEKSVENGLEWLRKFDQIELIGITMGAEGCLMATDKIECFVPGFPVEKPVDATGAGDAFCACMLHAWLMLDKKPVTRTWLQDAAVFANAAASLIVTRYGALRSMPSVEQVHAWMQKHEHRAKGRSL